MKKLFAAIGRWLSEGADSYLRAERCRVEADAARFGGTVTWAPNLGDIRMAHSGACVPEDLQ